MDSWVTIYITQHPHPAIVKYSPTIVLSFLNRYTGSVSYTAGGWGGDVITWLSSFIIRKPPTGFISIRRLFYGLCLGWGRTGASTTTVSGTGTFSLPVVKTKVISTAF